MKKICLRKSLWYFTRLNIECETFEGEQVDGKKPVVEGCSTPGNEFDDLGCFDIAYDARSRPDDTGRSFGPGCECRAVGKEVGVSFTFLPLNIDT